LYSPGTGALYCGLIDHLHSWADEREYKIYHERDEWYGDIVEDNDFVSPPGVKTFMDKVCNIKPRPYQYKAVYEALKNNRKLLLSPTGSGKSLMIYSLVRYYCATNKKILIVVPTTSLVEQMVNDFCDYGWSADEYVHKIYGGKDKNTDNNTLKHIKRR
jgi:superfamily II DNA or RNA helicase